MPSWLYSTHLTWQLFNDTLQFLTIHPAETTQCEMSRSETISHMPRPCVPPNEKWSGEPS